MIKGTFSLFVEIKDWTSVFYHGSFPSPLIFLLVHLWTKETLFIHFSAADAGPVTSIWEGGLLVPGCITFLTLFGVVLLIHDVIGILFCCYTLFILHKELISIWVAWCPNHFSHCSQQCLILSVIPEYCWVTISVLMHMSFSCSSLSTHLFQCTLFMSHMHTLISKDSLISSRALIKMQRPRTDPSMALRIHALNETSLFTNLFSNLSTAFKS